MSYLHGVETVTAANPNGSIRVVRSSVCFLVGISPTGPVQTLTLCNNEKDDAQFGAATPANDIATTLKIIRAAAASPYSPGGAGAVIVVNVFDADDHTDDLVDTDTVTITDGKGSFEKHLYGTIVVKKASDDTTVASNKYTIDEWGNIEDVTAAGELEDLEIYLTGKYVIPAVAADIVGAVDVNNVRTGMKLHALCMSTFGYTPKVFLSPKYSALSAVFAEGRAIADANRGRWLHDCATGDTVSEVIAARASGSIGWNTTHKRTDLVYPWLKTTNAFAALAAGDDNTSIVWPHSAFRAGIIINNDNDPTRGYWTSPSNIEINGCTGAETDIYTSASDSNAENQLLNAAGIICYINNGGIREYGNRSAMYPGTDGATTFINLQRVDDIVAESMELSWMNHNDKNITQPLIDTLVQEGNNLVAKLIQRGALLPGSKVSYVAADNPTVDLQNGQIKIRRTWMTGTPAERITIISEMDTLLLKFPNS